jgi:hypothetical protein
MVNNPSISYGIVHFAVPNVNELVQNSLLYAGIIIILYLAFSIFAKNKSPEEPENKIKVNLKGDIVILIKK